MISSSLIEYIICLLGVFVALLWFRPGRQALIRNAVIVFSFGGLCYMLFTGHGHVENLVFGYMPHVLPVLLFLLGRYMLKRPWRMCFLAIGVYALVRWLADLVNQLLLFSSWDVFEWLPLFMAMCPYLEVLCLWLIILLFARKVEGVSWWSALLAAAACRLLFTAVASCLLPSAPYALMFWVKLVLFLLALYAVLHYVLQLTWRRSLSIALLVVLVLNSVFYCCFRVDTNRPTIPDETKFCISPLVVAAAQGNHDAVLALLGAGADVQVRDEDGNTPLLAACIANDLKVIQMLLRAGADVHAVNHDGYTPLLMSILFDGSAEIVETLLCAGAEPNCAINIGATPLHYAAQPDGEADEARALAVMRLLLERGCAVDAQDMDGQTALHLCVSCGFTKGVQLLLEHNAAPALSDSEGRTPLQYAEEEGYAEIVELLRRESGR